MALKILGGVNFNAQKGTNMADGSAASDAATYGQLVNMVNGLDFKSSVDAASTANITLTAPGATIDGVTMSAGMSFLAKDQSTASQNGIYDWNGASATATRRTDADANAEVTSGLTVVVIGGTVNADTQWTLNTTGTITVGTTALTFARSGGTGSTLTAGNGITLPGNAITVNPASGGGISVAAGGVSVDRTKVPNIYSANIGDGSTTAIVVTHNLGTKDVVLALRQVSDDVEVMTDWTATSTNTITITFPTAPTSAQYRATVMG